MRQPHQVALDLAELRDVVEDADVVRHGAGGVALLRDRGPAGVEAAVLARGAHLALPVAGGLQRGAHLAAHVAPADAEAERGGLLALQLVGVVAADVAEGLVDGDDAAVAVGDDEALARLLEHGGGELQLVLDGLALGDVAALDQQVGRQRRARAGSRGSTAPASAAAPSGRFTVSSWVATTPATAWAIDVLQRAWPAAGVDAQLGDLVEAAAGDLRMRRRAAIGGRCRSCGASRRAGRARRRAAGCGRSGGWPGARAAASGGCARVWANRAAARPSRLAAVEPEQPQRQDDGAAAVAASAARAARRAGERDGQATQRRRRRGATARRARGAAACWLARRASLDA